MHRTVVRLGLVALATTLVAAPALAQSTGNFAASIATAQCVVNDTTGSLTGGLTGTLLDTTLKTPNSAGTALVIRPSLVTGLFTKTRITQYDTDAAAVAGVEVRVLIDGKTVAPGTPYGVVAGDNDGWVYYDKRFQQLSTNLFSKIDACGTDVGTAECYLELVQSTLSAHSLDFVVGNVGVGDHTLKVEWRLQPSAANANEKACVGPAVLAVEQVKTFSTSGGIVIQ